MWLLSGAEWRRKVSKVVNVPVPINVTDFVSNECYTSWHSVIDEIKYAGPFLSLSLSLSCLSIGLKILRAHATFTPCVNAMF